MAKLRTYTDLEIREVRAAIEGGKLPEDACRRIGMHPKTYYRRFARIKAADEQARAKDDVHLRRSSKAANEQVKAKPTAAKRRKRKVAPKTATAKPSKDPIEKGTLFAGGANMGPAERNTRTGTIEQGPHVTQRATSPAPQPVTAPVPTNEALGNTIASLREQLASAAIETGQLKDENGKLKEANRRLSETVVILVVNNLVPV